MKRKHSSLGTLREEILELIRLAIEKRLDLGMDEEEAQVDAYEKFVSYCIQYHTDGIKPLGFVLSDYLVAVIKAEQVCSMKMLTKDNGKQ